MQWSFGRQSSGRVKARRGLFAVACGTLLLAGCGSGASGPELADVRGTVTLDGKPVADAVVIFTPILQGSEEARPAQATTDGHGRYELRYSTTRSGARPGKYKVTVATFRETGEDGQGNPVAAAPETLPETYNARSTLTAEVMLEGQPIDFALKSDAGPIVQPKGLPEDSTED